MNRDLRRLMAFIAYNQMDKARDFVKKFCESNGSRVITATATCCSASFGAAADT